MNPTEVVCAHQKFTKPIIKNSCTDTFQQMLAAMSLPILHDIATLRLAGPWQVSRPHRQSRQQVSSPGKRKRNFIPGPLRKNQNQVQWTGLRAAAHIGGQQGFWGLGYPEAANQTKGNPKTHARCLCVRISVVNKRIYIYIYMYIDI